MGFFSKIKKGLSKTKQQMVSKISMLLNSFTKIDEDLFEQLEETLIMSDVGVETSVEICERLRKMVKEQGITDPNEIMKLIHEIAADMLGEDQKLDLSTKPTVIMVIGVNGAGKTTTIGKLCHKLKNDGKKVLVAAADTFRAAAIDQLQVWTERAGVDLVKHAEGSDAAAVVFDAITAAKARGCDVVIVDTAGRLHNKKNLMDELAKINRIVSQQAEGCSREILLVLDATTGQNAVNQAKLFKETADITGIVLTKLDGTAKGGIVISIKNELGIPVKLVGLGEKIDDLQEFSNVDFVNALFEDDVLEEKDDQEAEDEEENISASDTEEQESAEEQSDDNDEVSEENETEVISMEENETEAVSAEEDDTEVISAEDDTEAFSAEEDETEAVSAEEDETEVISVEEDETEAVSAEEDETEIISIASDETEKTPEDSDETEAASDTEEVSEDNKTEPEEAAEDSSETEEDSAEDSEDSEQDAQSEEEAAEENGKKKKFFNFGWFKNKKKKKDK